MKKIIFTFLFILASFVLSTKASWAYSKGEVLLAVTSIRSDYSQKSLTENKQLDKAAETKLADIQKYTYWAHNNPSTGKKWVSFVREAGFKGPAGENLAKGFSDTNKIITAWLNSPGHKKNLLSANFNLVGIAIGEVNYKSGTETVVVLTFGKQQKLMSFFENLFPNQQIALL